MSIPEHQTAPDASFSFEDAKKPHVFLQWKGTNACFDFHCECGAMGHFDGYFAYVVKCGKCCTYYEMPFVLFPRKIGPDEKNKLFVVPEMDDDDDQT